VFYQSPKSVSVNSSPVMDSFTEAIVPSVVGVKEKVMDPPMAPVYGPLDIF